jgi:hypothetical protein
MSSRRAAPGAPFTFTAADASQIAARYGQRLYFGGDTDLAPGAPESVCRVHGPEADWISGVAVEIVVNETNVAIHVNQRPPGVLVAYALGADGRSMDIVESGQTFLTAAGAMALALRPHPASEVEVPLGEFGFRQGPFFVGHSGTVDIAVATPHTMWMRCIVAAVSIYRQNSGPATWPQVHEWLVSRGCWQQGRPGEAVPNPKDAQQYTAWEAIRAYRLQPSDYSVARAATSSGESAALRAKHTDLWRSVQRALYLRGLPTPVEAQYVEQRLGEYWIRYGKAVPNPSEPE